MPSYTHKMAIVIVTIDSVTSLRPMCRLPGDYKSTRAERDWSGNRSGANRKSSERKGSGERKRQNTVEREQSVERE